MTKLDFYSDSGHGWLKIPIAELERLGIADKITKYSYMRNDFAYLEEDCDVSLYCDTIRKSDPEVLIQENKETLHNENSVERIF